MIILTVKRNLTWSVPGKKSLRMIRRDSLATIQHWSWCISTKHEGATRAHPDNWKMKAKIFPRFARTDRRYAPLCRCLLQPAPPTSNSFRRLCHIQLNRKEMWYKWYVRTHTAQHLPYSTAGMTIPLPSRSVSKVFQAHWEEFQVMLVLGHK